jgi:hypothetical protein
MGSIRLQVLREDEKVAKELLEANPTPLGENGAAA